MNTIDFYGAEWCPDCQRAKAYLKTCFSVKIYFKY